MPKKKFKRNEDAMALFRKKKKTSKHVSIDWEGGPGANRIRYVVEWK